MIQVSLNCIQIWSRWKLLSNHPLSELPHILWSDFPQEYQCVYVLWLDYIPNKFLYSLEIPPDKPPPLKYHLYTKKDSQKAGDHQEDVSESEDDDEATELDATLEEKQHLYYQQQQSSILLTTECFVVSPGAAIPGSLAVTSDSIYFTADEESEEMRKLDQQVRSVFFYYYYYYYYFGYLYRRKNFELHN